MSSNSFWDDDAAPVPSTPPATVASQPPQQAKSDFWDDDATPADPATSPKAQPPADPMDSMPWEVQAVDPKAIGTYADQIGRNIPIAGPLTVKAGLLAQAFEIRHMLPDSKVPSQYKGKTVDEIYDDLVSQDAKQQAGVQQQYPKASMLAGVSGASLLGNPLAIEAPAGANLATKVGTGLVNAGTYGQILQGDALARGQSQDQAQNAGDAAAAIGSIVPGAQVAGKVFGQAGRVAASTMSGVSGPAIDRYLENPEAIKAAQKYVDDPTLLKSELDSTVGKVTGDVDTAKAGVDVAKSQVGDAKLTARDARANANQQAIDAWRSAKEALNATGAPEGMAGNIVDNLNQQGEKLGQMSGDAFDILADEGTSFKAGDLIGAVDGQMNRLKIGGVEPAIGPDKAAYDALGQFKGMVKQIADKSGKGLDSDAGAAASIDAPVVKRLIQTLDNASKAAYQTNAGALGPEAATNLAKVRASLNGMLRDSSDAYAAQMDQLAPQVQLVSEMSKVFGTEQKAMTALRAAGNPNTPQGYTVRQMLGRYDAANGTDFTKQLGEYFKARETLQSPTALEAYRQGLPEVQTAAGQLPEEDALNAAQQGLDQSNQTLAEKQLWAEPVSKLGPNSTENVIKTVQGGRGQEVQKQLSNLDETYGTNHLQDIKDAGVAKQFERPSTNGSRKAVIGGAIGGAVGHATGMPGGAWVGSAVGSVVGGIADKYGSQAVKVALDAGIGLNKLAGTKYLAPLMAAAQRGPQALAVTHYLMTQQHPDYQLLSNPRP